MDRVKARIVDYMQEEFKDCLRRSSKSTSSLQRNCAMMFEVKMDSKRLNREPIIYGLVEKYCSMKPGLTEA